MIAVSFLSPCEAVTVTPGTGNPPNLTMPRCSVAANGMARGDERARHAERPARAEGAAMLHKPARRRPRQTKDSPSQSIFSWFFGMIDDDDFYGTFS